MKQKKYFILAAAAILMAACSENDIAEKQSPQAQQAGEQTVEFGAYVNRGITRAGNGGTLTTSGIPSGTLSLQTEGFGVFGYYTNNEGYSETAVPDFMYNQEVSGPGWTYTPIKYWPNEFGTAAASERIDYLTFFAYAPYVTSDPKTGKVAATSTETGIIGMSRNTATGDPLIKYAVDFAPQNCVDLCWGVAAELFNETVTGTASPQNNILQGAPFVEVIKPLTNSKIKFDFKHALAQLNIQIDTDVDVMSHAGGEADDWTRIFVRSVTFEGFTDKGTLNLNSNYNTSHTPTWYNINADGNLSTKAVSVYDGRYDGREGVVNVQAPNETPQGLNPNIIQSGAYTVSSSFASTTPGVKHVPVNLFNPDGFSTNPEQAPIFVIPNQQPLKITVVYDVETYDNNLSTFLSDGQTHGSTIENAITKVIYLSDGTTPMQLEAGKKYTVKLHLGLTSVKFDASVSEWEPTPISTDADLPFNLPSFSVAPGGSASTNVPYTQSTGIFEVTGLTVGATTTNTFTTVEGTIDGTPTVGDDGKVAVPYTINANNKITKLEGKLEVSEGGNKGTLNIIQAACPLGFSITSQPVADGTDIELTPTAAVEASQWTSADWTIVRMRNGISTTLEKNASPSANTYDISEIAGTPQKGKVTLGAGAKAGDVYTITVQAGDAPAESKSFTVNKAAGLLNAFAPTTYTYYLGAPVNPSQTTTVASGDGTITYSIAKSIGNGTSTATINATSGVVAISSPQAGDQFIVTATVADGANYTYDVNTTTYTITISKSAGTISFADASRTYSGSDVSQTVTKDGDGVVTYSIVKTSGTGSASINPTTGIIDWTSVANSDTYTVTATVEDSPSWSYAEKTKTYTITVSL